MRTWMALVVAWAGCATDAGEEEPAGTTSAADTTGPSGDGSTRGGNSTGTSPDGDSSGDGSRSDTASESGSSTGGPIPSRDWCAEATTLMPYVASNLILPLEPGYDLYHRDIDMPAPGVFAYTITRQSWAAGTLTPLAALDVAEASTVLFADFDGDAAIDYFGHSSGADTATFHFGQPEPPGFGLPQSYPTPGTNRYLAAADFDGDGDDDIFGYHNSLAEQWVGVFDGEGGMTPLVTGWGPDDVGSTAAVVDHGDVTRVAASFEEQLGIGFPGQVVVYQIGPASIEIESAGPEGEWPTVIDVRDNDGDGHGDVLALHSQAPFGLRYYASDGSGQLQHTQTFEDANDYYIAARDFDGDGDSDLLYWQLDTDIAQVRENLAGVFADAVELPELPPGIVASHAADFDGDGREDLVLADFGATQPGDAGYTLLHLAPC